MIWLAAIKNERYAILICNIHCNINFKISIASYYCLVENFKGQQGLMHFIHYSRAFLFHMPGISSISLLAGMGQVNLCHHVMCFKMRALINEELNKTAATEKMTKSTTTNTGVKGRAPKDSGFLWILAQFPLIAKQAPTGKRNNSC